VSASLSRTNRDARSRISSGYFFKAGMACILPLDQTLHQPRFDPYSHGRRDIGLVDVPCFDRPVRLRWRKRTWRCVEASCPVKVFTEQDDQVAPPRALLTTRACWWAIGQIRHEHASVAGIACQLGTTWNTVWAAVRPLLEAMADDESRFAGVARLGVDEHVVRHEALLFRMEVRDLHRFAVVAAG